MPTSSFSVSRDQCIVEALQICGAYDITNPPTSADYNSVSFTFNCMVKAWVMSGMPIWQVQTVLLPMVGGQNLYQIGPYATGTGSLVITNRMDRVIYAFVRQVSAGQNFDTPIDQLTFQQYNQYGNKQALGVVNSMLYVPNTDTADGLNTSTVTTYPTPVSSAQTIGMVAQVQLNDLNAGTDVPDFPQECFLGLCWSLADLISMKYATDMQRVTFIANRAKMMYDRMVDWSQENSDSIRFMYDKRMGAR